MAPLCTHPELYPAQTEMGVLTACVRGDLPLSCMPTLRHSASALYQEATFCWLTRNVHGCSLLLDSQDQAEDVNTHKECRVTSGCLTFLAHASCTGGTL